MIIVISVQCRPLKPSSASSIDFPAELVQGGPSVVALRGGAAGLGQEAPTAAMASLRRSAFSLERAML
ncbi:MAG: hypothetical protein KC933_03940 [Myxococcales bacterium]|nr:hypothetical protein [Myxococcales bacterium]